MNSSVKQEDVQPAPPKPADLGGVLWECGTGAFMQAIFVIVLGSLAVGLVGGLLHGMLPSLPPGVGGRLEAGTESGWKGPWTFLKDHRLLIVFSVLFFLNLRARLWPRQGQGISKPATRAEKLAGRLATDWFSLLVGNAFGAMVAAAVFLFLQQFSWTKILFDTVVGLVLHAFHSAAVGIFGQARIEPIDAFVHWYGRNQFKFTFWFFYWAAICDDLGIPNLKTLVRWLWGRPKNLTEGNEGEELGKTSNIEHRTPNIE